MGAEASVFWGLGPKSDDCMQRQHPPHMSWKQAASLATLAAQIGDVSNAGGMNVRDNVSSSRISGTNGTISSSRIHSGPFHGPFHYAKGPMYCMSSSLVQQLVTDRWLQAQVRAALAAPLHAKQGVVAV